jgi:hypothetical protein
MIALLAYTYIKASIIRKLHKIDLENVGFPVPLAFGGGGVRCSGSRSGEQCQSY